MEDLLNSSEVDGFIRIYKRDYFKKKQKKRISIRIIWCKTSRFVNTHKYYLQLFINGQMKDSDEINENAYKWAIKEFGNEHPGESQNIIEVAEHLPINHQS